MGNDAIVITRHALPSGQSETWRIERSDACWTSIAPDGTRRKPDTSPLAALTATGACLYERGVGLDIQTAGLIDPFELLPALESWTEVDEEPVEEHEWWTHETLGWAHEFILSRSSRDQFELDRDRVILIDDLVCAVHRPDSTWSSTAAPHVVIFEWDDSLLPAFVEVWATTNTENGYGHGYHAIGEIKPGFEGQVFVAEEIASLRIRPLPDGHSGPSEEEMRSWISANVSMTPGLEEHALEVSGDAVTVVFPEGGGYAEASGGLGPAVRRTQGPTDEQGFDARSDSEARGCS
jgi:hypothetical protein